MSSGGAPPERRAWPVRSAPRQQLVYLVAVELLVLTWSAFELVRVEPTSRNWLQSGLLVALAVVFEEAAKRAARLRLRFGAELRQDMTSVWAIAAAIALPRGLALCVVAVVLTFIWVRQERPTGAPLYAMAFNTADFVASCLFASVVAEGIRSGLAEVVPGVATAAAVVCAVIAFTVLNRLLVTGALLTANVRGRGLIGSMNENLIEFATVCLGGLVAVVVVHEPWLTILVIAPLFALQRGALVSDLETAATVDTKTGLLNAIAWEQVAQREVARALRAEQPLAVLLIDIDRFKLVNDEFGHLVGDSVLREIGRCLDAGVREYDSVGRFGGEEFVAVLPDADDAAAAVIAERLRARINRLHIRDLVEGVDASNDAVLSVSIGVAGLHSAEAELTDLLRDADAALYRAKDAGRNQVVLAGSDPGETDARLRLA